MSYYRNIAGVKWYYCLIPKENSKALFSDYPRNTCLNKFLVCWDFYDQVHKKSSKIYAIFESYLDFAKYFLKIPDEFKCFYELILGENYQKPHFDLDMELNDDEIKTQKDEIVLNDLINAIINILQEKNITLNLEKDICIYSSHGEKKRSYHLVINSYCHTNNKEAKAFYYAVMEKLPKEYFEKKWIDLAVYSKTQQFRTYQSRKFGSNRIKQLMISWKYIQALPEDALPTDYNGVNIKHIREEVAEDEDHEFLLNFEESMVTARISNCKLLPSFEIPDEFNKNKTFEKGENLEYDLAMEAIALLAHKGGTTPDDKMFPFRFDCIQGPFVVLKRVRPSKCKVCCRIHYKQNPYLLIVPETKAVFFHCRRAPPDKKVFIGSLKSDEEETSANLSTSSDSSNIIKSVGMTWTEQKISQMKELAATSVTPSKKCHSPKNSDAKPDPQVVSLVLTNILKRSQ